FDYHPGDIYWCTADVGWVTGHSYLLYGPLACGATTLMVEGDKAIEGTDRSSLRILGSVGEPINPEAWEWYWKKIG
ncbi:acetyl-coenzyme A synthetase, partial [Escherichia coli]|nr:acetyl-coenzyme A synthetase [Escherichia coli]